MTWARYLLVPLPAAERWAQPPSGWPGVEPERATAELIELPESSAAPMACRVRAMMAPRMPAAGSRLWGALTLQRPSLASRATGPEPAVRPERCAALSALAVRPEPCAAASEPAARPVRGAAMAQPAALQARGAVGAEPAARVVRLAGWAEPAARAVRLAGRAESAARRAAEAPPAAPPVVQPASGARSSGAPANPRAGSASRQNQGEPASAPSRPAGVQSVPALYPVLAAQAKAPALRPSAAPSPP
jgi:hypothetical protein